MKKIIILISAIGVTAAAFYLYRRETMTNAVTEPKPVAAVIPSSPRTVSVPQVTVSPMPSPQSAAPVSAGETDAAYAELRRIQKSGSAADASVLLRYLESSDPGIQRFAIDNLQALGIVDAISAISRLTESPNDLVRIGSFMSIGTLAAGTDNPVLKEQAHEALAASYEKRIHQLSDREKWSEIATIMESLGKVETESSRRLLSKSLMETKDEPALTSLAVRALGGHLSSEERDALRVLEKEYSENQSSDAWKRSVQEEVLALIKKQLQNPG